MRPDTFPWWRQASVTALTDNDRAVLAFARQLHTEHGFEGVWLIDARARQLTTDDGDYRLLLVSECFRDCSPRGRQIGLHDIFYRLGGFAPLDLICLTPEEFEQAKGRASLVRAVMPEAIDLLAETPAPA